MSNNALLNKCCCFEYIKEKEKETPTKKKKGTGTSMIKIRGIKQHTKIYQSFVFLVTPSFSLIRAPLSRICFDAQETDRKKELKI